MAKASNVVKHGRKLQHAPKTVSSKKSLAGTEQASMNKPRWHGVDYTCQRACRRVNVPTARSPAQQAHNSNNPLGAKHAGEPVNGVRHIWGTLRACTHMTVISTLQRMTTIKWRYEGSSRRGTIMKSAGGSSFKGRKLTSKPLRLSGKLYLLETGVLLSTSHWQFPQ